MAAGEIAFQRAAFEIYVVTERLDISDANDVPRDLPFDPCLGVFLEHPLEIDVASVADNGDVTGDVVVFVTGVYNITVIVVGELPCFPGATCGRLDGLHGIHARSRSRHDGRQGH